MPNQTDPTQFRAVARERFLQLLRTPYWGSGEGEKLPGDALRALAPAADVVETLAEEPLRIYRGLWYAERALEPEDHLSAKEINPCMKLNGRLVLRWAHLPGLDGNLSELQEALGSWAESWYLEAEWAFDRALETLAEWCEYPKVCERRSWSTETDITVTPTFRYHVDWWDYSESFVAFQRRARAELLTALDKNLRSTEKEARKTGWPLGKDGHGSNAYLWTVRYQILGEPYSMIADDVEVDRKTVREAVGRVLEFLELPRRPSRPGRRPGSRDRHRARR